VLSVFPGLLHTEAVLLQGRQGCATRHQTDTATRISECATYPATNRASAVNTDFHGFSFPGKVCAWPLLEKEFAGVMFCFLFMFIS
jgi:hypothetical protein